MCPLKRLGVAMVWTASTHSREEKAKRMRDDYEVIAGLQLQCEIVLITEDTEKRFVSEIRFEYCGEQRPTSLAYYKLCNIRIGKPTQCNWLMRRPRINMSTDGFASIFDICVNRGTSWKHSSNECWPQSITTWNYNAALPILITNRWGS